VFEADPERAWNLVSYVLEISGRRREDTRAGRSEIPAGLIKPYLAAPSAGDSETPAGADSSTDSSAE
jgi:hypothetical protein